MSTPTTARDDAFMFDPGAETMSRDALTALQVERTQHTLEHAYAKVPLYRQRFDATGVKPGDFKALADIARFPFTLKSDLRQFHWLGLMSGSNDVLATWHSSPTKNLADAMRRETLVAAARSAGFAPKTPVIEITGVCAHCRNPQA